MINLPDLILDVNAIYQQDKNIALSRFEHTGNKVWFKGPFESSFVAENAYTGNDLFIRRDRWNGHFYGPIPKLYNTTKLFKNCILTAVLWIPDHVLYTNRLVMSGHEFYRCFNQTLDESKWLMIPLYSRMGTNTPENDNPGIRIKDGSTSGLYQTLEVFHPDIFAALRNMFKNMINVFQTIIKNKERRLYVQFPRYPASFLT